MANSKEHRNCWSAVLLFQHCGCASCFQESHLFWSSFAGCCCHQGSYKHSLVAVPPWPSTSNSPPSALKAIQQSSHRPSLLLTTNLQEISLFCRENLMIFHWHVSTAEQYPCPRSGSQHVQNNELYPQVNSLSGLNCDTNRYILNSLLSFQILVKL